MWSESVYAYVAPISFKSRFISPSCHWSIYTVTASCVFVKKIEIDKTAIEFKYLSVLYCLTKRLNKLYV